MIAVVRRPWFMWVKVVVERLLEDGRRGLSGKLKAAVLLPGCLGHVALGQVGRAESASTTMGMFCVQREGRVSEPRTPG